MGASSCLACEKRVPTRGRRRCPLCRQAFRSGWEGVETHWRAKHAAALPYERFWSSLCRDHRAARAADCPSCRKSIPRSRKWPRQCPECAQVFAGRGWGGIESHWRASHPDVMAYEDFFASLCPAHRGGGDPSTDYLPLGERQQTRPDLLDTFGLGENPPTSREIRQRVKRLCAP